MNSSPAIGSDETVYVGSRINGLYAINPDGTIYVGSDDKNLYAIYGSGSLASTPWPMFRHDLRHTGSK